MQVANPNNIKIYNLSAGKSLPEWLSDRKRRKLLKNDGELRRRIELMQVRRYNVSWKVRSVSDI